MNEQQKNVERQQNPGNQSQENEKEGSFGQQHQPGQQPPKKDPQGNDPRSKEQDQERKTGTNR